uniref:Uncharacterized protein n=1 Tax=Avena sativa TaxID=4498 RepID=A0ACD5XE03_AVESA
MGREMDVEAEPAPGKAEGEAAMADAEAPAKAESRFKMAAERWKMIRTPPTEEELQQREKDREKYLSETWERFRDNWLYASDYPFDAVTEIPCMRFTDIDVKGPDYYHYGLEATDTLQIVSVQVKPLDGSGLQWPLDVYGFVAVRDIVDRKRIMLFNRQRDDCQSINKQDPYLRLTGPTRGVIINSDHSYLEVVLKKKGLTESEDEYLSKFVRCYTFGCVDPIQYTNKLCTLEVDHYTVRLSVEATVSVRVFQGQWPQGFRGVLNATTDDRNEIPIALLDFDDDELPVDDDGSIKLSRRVVCVGHDDRLGVSLFEDGVGDLGDVWIAAEKSRRATNYMYVKKFDLWLEVIVAWSLF